MTHFLCNKKGKSFKVMRTSFVLLSFHPEFTYQRSGSKADQSQLKIKQTSLDKANKGTVWREYVVDFSIESGKCHMETLADFGKCILVSFNHLKTEYTPIYSNTDFSTLIEKYVVQFILMISFSILKL